jgi:hypothetical protein
MIKIMHRAALAQKFGIEGEAEIDARVHAAGRLESGDGRLLGHTGQHGAAQDNRDAMLRGAQQLADIGADPAYIVQVETAVAVAGRSDTDEDQIAVRKIGRGGGSEPAGLTLVKDQLLQSLFDDRRKPLIDQTHLMGVDVDADDVVSHLGQAGRRDAPHISQSKDADLHSPVTSRNHFITYLAAAWSVKNSGADDSHTPP